MMDDAIVVRGEPVVVSATQRELTIAYAVAVLCGLVPAFMSAYAWMLPLLAMFGYLAYGYRRAVAAGLTFEFADGFYYLGFTLSIGSLLAALEPFNFSARPDPERIFHYFGLGMLSTLVGVVVRTLLQSYFRMPDESLEVTNRQIQEQAQEYLEGLRALVGRVQDDLQTASGWFGTHVEPSLGRVGAALAATERVALDAQRQAEGATKSLAAAVQGVADATVVHATAANRLVDQEDVMTRAARDLGAALAAAMSDVRRADVGTTLATLQTHIVAYGDALNRLQERTIAADVSPAAEQARTRLHGLATEVSGLTDTTERIHQHAAALADPKLSSAAAALSTALSTAATSASSWSEQAANGIETSRTAKQTAEHTAEAARALRDALDDVLAAATHELARRVTAANGASTVGVPNALMPLGVGAADTRPAA